jgi:hypothetical protein
MKWIVGCDRPQAATPSFAPLRIAVNPGPFREQQKGTDDAERALPHARREVYGAENG